MSGSWLVRGVDAIVAVALAIWAAYLSGSADRPLAALAVGAVAAVSFLVRRRWPLVPLLTLLVALRLLDGPVGWNAADGPFIVMLLWAFYSIGRHGSTRSQWIAGAAAAVLVLEGALRAGGLDDVIFPLLFAALPWFAGTALRRAAGTADSARLAVTALVDEADVAARSAESTERLRIARDLHDLLGHSLTGLSLQAQALRRGVAAGRPATEADLQRIEGDAQAVMTDLRRIVGLLGRDEDAPALTPPADFAGLDDLVARFERSGGRCRVTTSGSTRTLPPALSGAAFRVVQEALTNARRHGDGPVEVAVVWEPTRLRLTISNPLPGSGRPGTGGPDTGGGTGITGMRERVAMFGGRFEAGVEQDRWVVRAALPIPEEVE